MWKTTRRFLGTWTGRLILAFTGIGLFILLALPIGTASAQSAFDEPVAAQRGENLDQRLSMLYQRLQLAADSLALRLSSAEMIAENASAWIAELQEQGVDTGELETALTAFNESRATAQTQLDEANAVLAAGAGFDTDGNVTDRQQALDTLRAAGRSLRDASRELRDATIDFRRVVSDFIRDRRGQ